MASDADNSSKTYKVKCRNTLKTVSSSTEVTRRPKASIEKKRLQHPESFPLPKKQATKQVPITVDSFRERSFDTKHLKNFDASLPLSTDYATVLQKSNGKLWKCKGTSNRLSDNSPSLQNYPNKSTIKVSKTKHEEGKINTGSRMNSTHIDFPNFVLCCASKTILKEDDPRLRMSADGESSFRSTFSGLNSPRKMKEYNSVLKENKNESQMCSNQEYSKEMLPRRPNSASSNSQSPSTHKSNPCPNCSAECSDCNQRRANGCNSKRLQSGQGSQCNHDISDDVINPAESTSSIGNLKAFRRQSKKVEEEMKPSSQFIDAVETAEGKDVDPQCQKLEGSTSGGRDANIEFSRNDVQKLNSAGTEISTSNCGDSSDEFSELKNCKRGLQVGKSINLYKYNDDRSIKATCTCCVQEEIRTSGEVNPTNSNFNEWLQMQNANAAFQYPFCCPESGGFYGCCCGGTAPIPSCLTPPNVPAMQSIPPPSHIMPPHAFFQPGRFERSSDRPPTGSNEFSSLNDAKASEKSWLPTPNFALCQDRFSSGCENTMSSQAVKERGHSTRSKHNTSLPGREGSRDKTSQSEEDRPMSSSGQHLRNRKDKNEQNKHQTEIPQEVRTPEQWGPNDSNNFNNGYVPNPFYGCNILPPYQGPWCFPWWYSPLPPGYDQCFNTLPGCSNAYSPYSHVFPPNPLLKK